MIGWRQSAVTVVLVVVVKVITVVVVELPSRMCSALAS